MKTLYLTPSGKIYNLFADMLNENHLLIAGATGSGKSVLINGLITTALYNSPNKVKFIFIDCKRVELYDYKPLQHCLYYADNAETAITALKMALDIIENRYKLMQQKHIKEYNDSRIYVIIDELADLMTMNKYQVTPILQRIGQIGRAANVHLICATQCPLTTIIPTSIKVNFTGIIGLKTAIKQHSRNIIDMSGCELLPNPKKVNNAYCYYKSGVNCDLYNIPYVSNIEINRIIKHWLKQKSVIWQIKARFNKYS